VSDVYIRTASAFRVLKGNQESHGIDVTVYFSAPDAGSYDAACPRSQGAKIMTTIFELVRGAMAVAYPNPNGARATFSRPG